MKKNKSFEEIIVEVSNEQISKLYPILDITIEKPETGIKILNNSAKFVIRDSAKICKEYLPLHLFINLDNPIASLQNKVTKDILTNFVNSCSTSKSSKLLKDYIFQNFWTNNETSIPLENKIDEDDIYGDYSSTIIENNKTLDDLEKLCIIFKLN